MIKRIAPLLIVVLTIFLSGCTVNMVVTTPKESENIFGAWIKDIEGQKGKDGYYFDQNNSLRTINIFSMTGDRWELHEDKLTIWTHTERYPNPEPINFQITELTSDKLVLLNGSEEMVYQRPDHTTNLINTRWVVSFLPGVSSPKSTTGDVYLRFVDDKKIEGFSGCNRFFGGYEAGTNSLTFGPIAGTRMFCSDMESEDTLLKMLAGNLDFMIVSDHLYLYKESKLQAVFVATYL